MGRTTAEQYEKHRKAMAERMRQARASASDIGELPGVLDAERKAECGESLQKFCETYRPAAFSMGWSEDHLKVLQRVETTVKNGGLFGLAMPRGSGKTTITVTAALWALLYGHRRWVCLVGATGPKAQSLLKAIKTELRFNQMLLDDFPEVCWPIKCLDGRAARANGQTFQGESTAMEWLSDTIKLPTIKGSPASGASITVCGITGDIRGQQETLTDGSVIRPDYVILDDPQTRESARSPQQTEDRLATLNGDILGLAGPGVKISGVMPCTVISRGDMADQILDREQCPEWHGERTKLLYGWPERMDLWNRYQEIRELEFKNDGDGEESMEFYNEHHEDMNEGCYAAWEDRHNIDERDGVQHAMHLFFRDEAAFWAEFQNEPIESVEDETVSEEQIAAKVSDLEIGVISNSADVMTAFIDVQKDMLFYVVCAFKQSDYSGWIVDYGGFPDQKTTNFRYAQAKRKLSKMWPGESLEVILKRSLTELTNDLLGRSWKREDGSEVHITRLMIDANWGASRDIVYKFVRGCDHRAVILPSHGKYVGASSEPLNAKAAKKRGVKLGVHWQLKKAQDHPIRYCLYDTNHWKTFTFSRWATENGTPGSLQLYKASPVVHKTFARHQKSEYPVRTVGRGREVDEWKQKPDRADNHWFDCLVGCHVAASIQGCELIGKRVPALSGKKQRKTRSVSYL